MASSPGLIMVGRATLGGALGPPFLKTATPQCQKKKNAAAEPPSFAFPTALSKPRRHPGAPHTALQRPDPVMEARVISTHARVSCLSARLPVLQLSQPSAQKRTARSPRGSGPPWRCRGG